MVVFSRMAEGGGLRAIHLDLVVIEKRPYWGVTRLLSETVS